MMGGPDNDPILVGKFGIDRIIGIKCPSPHGGPQKVSFQSKDKFKDMFIKFMVESTKIFVDPSRKCRSLVIDKDTPVSDGWFSITVPARQDIQCLFLRDRDICPPVPGRYTHL